MSIRNDIIRKALVLIGAGSSASSGSGNKASKSQSLAEEFVDSTIEETMLSVRWVFALRQVRDVQGRPEEFTSIPDIDDCLKVAVIVPSNLEWYIEGGKIYFKIATNVARKIESIFYYSADILKSILAPVSRLNIPIPSGFISLASLSLAAQIAFALYSDSIFADGLRRQYLLKLEEMRQTYSLDYNLVNSGNM